MRKKRILVTGGAGFLGSNLCERLLSAGNHVTAVDNFFSGDRRNVEHLRSYPDFELIQHDITIPFFREVDEIYNLACPSAPVHYTHDPVNTLKTSLIGTTNVLELARRTHARVVHASSGKIYGHTSKTPILEHDWGHVNPVGYRSAYAEGKRAAETICSAYRRQYNVDVRVARLFNLYGPRMSPYDGKAVSSFIMSALQGETLSIQSSGIHTRCFLYAEDAVDALIRMMQAPEQQSLRPVNIGNDAGIEIGKLAKMILDLTGSRSKIVCLNLNRESPPSYTPDIGYAREYLQWEPIVPIEEGLIQTVRYFEDRLRKESRVFPGISWVEMA